MARTFSSLEEKVDFALQQSEDALLAAAQKGGEAEVSKAEFAQYRIQFAMTLDERLNVNQVPVRLGDLLARLDVLEQDVAEVLGAASPEVSELLQRVQALEGAGPSPVAGGQVAQPGDQSAIARRLLALEDDVFSAAAERSKLDHRIGLVEAPAAEQAKAVAAAKIAVAAATGHTARTVYRIVRNTGGCRPELHHPIRRQRTSGDWLRQSTRRRIQRCRGSGHCRAPGQWQVGYVATLDPAQQPE